MAPEALLEKLKIPASPETRSLPTMFDLPSENPEDPGLPDIYHPLQATLLSETLHLAMSHCIGTDQHLYYDPDHTLLYKRPDWFLALGVPSRFQGVMRKSYVVWAEGARPFLAIELLSPSTQNEDLGLTERKPDAPPTKWEVYEQILEIPYYIVYDHETLVLRAFRNENGRYRELSVHHGQIPIPEIDLELRLWQGTFMDQEATWLRWYDASGTMIPTGREDAHQQRAEKEKERAEKEKERAEKERLLALLKEAGIDPDKL